MNSTDSTILLYGDSFWISPFFFSCFVALTEKQIPFEICTWNLAKKENKNDEYRNKSLTGRIPAIVHNDFWLTESSAIVEYLDETFPEIPMLPRDRKERARARQLMAWIRSDLMPIRQERSTNTMFYQKADKPLSDDAREAVASLFRFAEQLIHPTRSTLFSQWSIADADLTWMLHRLILNDEEVPEKIRSYAVKHWERPSIKAFVERKRPAYEPY